MDRNFLKIALLRAHIMLALVKNITRLSFSADVVSDNKENTHVKIAKRWHYMRFNKYQQETEIHVPL